MKKIRRLMIAATLLMSALFNPVTGGYAEEPIVKDDQSGVVIYQLQTRSADSATAEFVVLYNASTEDINVTDWCVRYMSASGLSQRRLACIESTGDYELWLMSGEQALLVSDHFLVEHPAFMADFMFSSGMSSSGGHIVLEDNEGVEVDRVGYGTASMPEGVAVAHHTYGEVLSRDLEREAVDTNNNQDDFLSRPMDELYISGLYEVEIIVDLCKNLDGVQAELPAGWGVDESMNCFEDFCTNIDGIQQVAPDGYELSVETGECVEIVLENAAIIINELLPNVSGSDTGKEFIELYNPNNVAVNLAGYRLTLAPNETKEYVFTDLQLDAMSYTVVGDDISGITLPNATGVPVRLYAAAGNLVSEAASYTDAGDDMSWSLLNGAWDFTNQITPAADNAPSVVVEEPVVLASMSTLDPCPAGKFRNPLTNRCKNVDSTVTQLVPCGVNQFRNPETNRCKSISSSAGELAPCEEGKERNPETNRCRTIIGNIGDDGLPLVVDIVPEGQEGSVNIATISLVVAASLGYMLYEWRVELMRFYGRIRRMIVQYTA